MPAADIEIDEALVRALVSAQATSIADGATRPLRHVADGWDCSVWRWGEELAVRLPRRALAAPLIEHEQRVLSTFATRLAHTGLGVPAPVVAGRPGSGYPWSWSVVPWFEGTSGLAVPRPDRAAWAAPLAAALLALHIDAPVDHPVNPVRGVPLARRTDAVAGRVASLRGRIPKAGLDLMQSLWDAAIETTAWDRTAVWIHGDLHPGNLVARGPRLVALIDFGDVTAGDPAYDLAVAWVAFDARGREAFITAMGDRYDAATWTRAHGWAAAVTLMLLDQSVDNPEYAALGVESLSALSA